MDNLTLLKFNLQEKQFPYFTDEELALLLESNGNDVNKASYKGCLLKAQADDAIDISVLKTESNREYWLTLAHSYRGASGYNTTMQRADES